MHKANGYYCNYRHINIEEGSCIIPPDLYAKKRARVRESALFYNFIPFHWTFHCHLLESCPKFRPSAYLKFYTIRSNYAPQSFKTMPTI